MNEHLPRRAEQVGSLLRPAEVKQARSDLAASKISAAELRAIEDRCIRQLIAQQRRIGLRTITDGELRRNWWHFDFLRQLDGVEFTTGQKQIEFHGVKTASENIVVTGKVGLSELPMLQDYVFLQAASDIPPKFTIPGPPVLHFRGGRESISREAYPDLDDFFTDTTDTYKKILQAFYAAGCRYLQFDDTVWAYLCSEEERRQSRERGDDPESLPAIYAEMIKQVLADKPADMALTTHVCRGNFRSSWIASGGYEPVAEILFDIPYDGFFLEYDTGRAGGFEPLAYLPKGRQRAVLGLITSKSGELEDKDLLKRRVDEAAHYADIDQLCLSPQCGFASTKEGNLLTEAEQWRKLELVVEVASEIWADA